MSRIGKQPVKIPAGVTIDVAANMVSVKGPKGELQQTLSDRVSVTVEADHATINRKDDEKYSRADHGLYRSLLANMIQGVTDGFSKTLEVEGVGFKVAMAGQGLKMALGFSHEVTYQPPEGVQLSVEENRITVTGASKQLVGQTAADIRALKKPEPYKGKGIKYQDEYIVRKAGKAAGGGSA